MEYAELMEEIKKGQVKSVYLLYGEEVYFMNQIERLLINTILTPEEKDINLLSLEKDPGTKELISLIESVPFMGGKNVIHIRGTTLLRKSSNAEQGTDKADEGLFTVIGNMPDYTHLILSTTDKVDKRRKLFKMIEKHGIAVEFTPLKGKDIRSWIRFKVSKINKKLDNEAMEYLLGVISMMPQLSLTFLNNELEKVALFTGERSGICQRDLMEVMSSIPEVSIFSMIDAVCQKRLGNALQLLGEQLKSGEHPLKIISLLARQVRLMWQAEEMSQKGYGSRQIAERLGVVPFVGEKMLKQSKNFTPGILKQTMLALAAADYEVKAGKADNSVLEKIMIGMCNVPERKGWIQ